MSLFKKVGDFGRAFGLVFMNNTGVDIDAEEGEAADTTDSGTAQQTPWYVLAIDDDRLYLETLRMLLVPAGFKVMTAHSPSHGLDILRYSTNQVRVVLLDYNMPGLTGDEALRWIRQLHPAAKVVALTGAPKKDVPETFRKSVDGFLTKPCTGEQILQEVRSYALQYRERIGGQGTTTRAASGLIEKRTGTSPAFSPSNS